MVNVPTHKKGYRQGDYLVASVQPSLSDEDWVQLQRWLVESVGSAGVRGVVVNVAGVEVLDSFAARTLRDVVDMVRLRGAEAVIVGIQPGVALAMVQLGLILENVATALDVKEGIAYLDKQLRNRQ